MTSKTSKQLTLFESVMWGTSKQVQEILDKRDLTFDDRWTDYALLIIALRKKRKEIAKILLKKGCRIQKIPRIDASDTPLHYAVKIGDIEIVNILLSKGASINDIDQTGETPLCFAMKKKNHEMVDLMLSISNIGSVNIIDNDGFSHFHIACIRNNLNIVENFLKNGVDINNYVNFNAKQWSGYTPLHFAVYYRCLDIVKLLLNHNADVTIKNVEGMTPLHLALQMHNDIIVELILSSNGYKNVNPVDNNGLSHFHIACMKNHLIAVENYLQYDIEINQAVNLNSSFWPGYTSLHFAVKDFSLSSSSQISLIELLLCYKANVNIQDIQGQIPLHLACSQSHNKISKLIEDVINSSKVDLKTNKEIFYDRLSQIIRKIEQIKIVQLLLMYKSNVNAENINGETPLFYLYKNDLRVSNKMKFDDHILKNVIQEFNVKRKGILNILLENNSDLTVRNDLGETILHLIANINKEFNDKQKEEVAELILSKGADVNAEANNGLTPLHMAAENGHPELIKLFLKYNANINARESSEESTPLHLATSNQQIKAINALLENEADVTLTRCNRINVLHIMALINPETSKEAEFIESYDKMIKTFLKLGCDINAQDINGRTPLHLASLYLNNAATWSFLQHFANINIEDYGGETPLSFPINNTETCINIYYMFMDYVNMLKMTGLYVSEKLDSCYTKLYGKDPPDQKDDFLVQCKEEIEKMKSIKINSYSSLYDIIFKNSYEMEVYAGNELFQNILTSDDFEKNFNIYGNLLRSQFQKGLARKVLLKSAKDSFEFMLGFGLPDSCFEKIFHHLNDESLRNLIKAKTLKVCNKKTEQQQIICDQNECESLEKAISYCKNLYNKHMEIS